jgi:hypothetical protein
MKRTEAWPAYISRLEPIKFSMAPFNVMALKNPNPFISMQPKIFCLKNIMKKKKKLKNQWSRL